MSGELDPAASLVLADAAIRAQENDGDPVDRAQPESDLTKAIIATIGSREAVDLLFATESGTTLGNQLSSALHRTAISRRFYNDAVRACRAVRRQHLVRWFSLAGHTPMPQTVEIDWFYLMVLPLVQSWDPMALWMAVGGASRLEAARAP